MRIAYLVVCHRDPAHIARLASKLAVGGANVFVHVDLKSDLDSFKAALGSSQGVFFIDDRVNVHWAGFSAVRATLNLLVAARAAGKFDRFVLLQGADYPLKPALEIQRFFEDNRSVEFIRACNATRGKSKYIYPRARYYMYVDDLNIVKRLLNKMTRLLDLKLRSGFIELERSVLEIYWGSAQWAITGDCAEFVVEAARDKYLQKFFKHNFPADETFFHTLVHNSEFSSRTSNGGVEACPKNLTDIRNLHYFEYPREVRTFGDQDFEFLCSLGDLFVRKVSTEHSSGLLDRIDALHLEQVDFSSGNATRS